MRFRTHMLAAQGDANLFLWAWWHLARVLRASCDPFVTDGIFYPVGVDLAFHTIAPLSLALIWPVEWVAGVTAAVNVNQLVAAFLSATGSYFLAYRVCGNRGAALVAGVAFACVPYRFVHLGGHFNLIHAEVLPLGVLAFLRFRERGSPLSGLVLGLALAAAFLVDVQYAVMIGIAFGVLAMSLGIGAMTWRGVLLAFCGAVLVASPMLVPMARAAARGELQPPVGWGGADIWSADPLTWIVPPETHPIWG
ncbi:MAG: hypothetical protein C4344_01400, partial [Acidimicrobiia bacterium]